MSPSLQLDEETSDQKTNRKNSENLGTFAGVFTPSILTILGIILFLRLGFVTGSGGVGRALQGNLPRQLIACTRQKNV
jgi:hypothetical protein